MTLSIISFELSGGPEGEKVQQLLSTPCKQEVNLEARKAFFFVWRAIVFGLNSCPLFRPVSSHSLDVYAPKRWHNDLGDALTFLCIGELNVSFGTRPFCHYQFLNFKVVWKAKRCEHLSILCSDGCEMWAAESWGHWRGLMKCPLRICKTWQSSFALDQMWHSSWFSITILTISQYKQLWIKHVGKDASQSLSYANFVQYLRINDMKRPSWILLGRI